MLSWYNSSKRENKKKVLYIKREKRGFYIYVNGNGKNSFNCRLLYRPKYNFQINEPWYKNEGSRKKTKKWAVIMSAQKGKEGYICISKTIGFFQKKNFISQSGWRLCDKCLNLAFFLIINWSRQM